jgi:hypothetical protein
MALTRTLEAEVMVRPGGTLFVCDLERPDDLAGMTALVDTHAPLPDAALLVAMHERRRALFEASLRAALTADEVRSLVVPLGMRAESVRTTSDRHWTLACVKP